MAVGGGGAVFHPAGLAGSGRTIPAGRTGPASGQTRAGTQSESISRDAGLTPDQSGWAGPSGQRPDQSGQGKLGPN